MDILKDIGRTCARYRRRLRVTQTDVAKETGYSPQTISAFEHGRTNNIIILLWYFEHGLSLRDIQTIDPYYAHLMRNTAYKGNAGGD